MVDLKELSVKATPGIWEVDSEHDDDASYGAGPDHGTGFHNYFIGADVGGKWVTLLDTVNSDHKEIEEDYDKANAELACELVNAYRSNALVPRAEMEEAVAATIERCAQVAVDATILAREQNNQDAISTASLIAAVIHVLKDNPND